ncbi:MAG: tRNA uridine-5-carboxymethylaminomethyl(34) synthesis GTPase MnmE, partial [Lachnospiraceae bacterium]|nr:tRNA uridine-5-carboxymethylaminomethyl(34) synthesis GTPase MnmE [Lachnospiraceae bacterium]
MISKFSNDDTIAAISGGTDGAIGVIRISGPDALKVAGKIYRKSRKNLLKEDSEYFLNQNSHTIHYGFIVDDENQIIDEVIVLLMKAPSTYTREDVIEIDTHGGAFCQKKILRELIKNNVRIAEPGEFTRRAFLNGRVDLTQAESVMDVISSKNDFALKNSLNQLGGNLNNFIKEIRQVILDDLSYIEAGLDDPEHIDIAGYSSEILNHINDAKSRLKNLTDNFDNGRMLSQGINTVIVGKPNAGKSSLLNLFMDYDRAIVTDIAGTTRDSIEEIVRIGDVVLNLVDTAGIRETDNVIENIGVEKAKKYVLEADFIIYMIDKDEIFDEEASKIIDMIQKKNGVILINKVDKLSGDENDESVIEYSKEYTDKLGWKVIYFSTKTGDGFSDLKDYISELFYKDELKINDQIHLTSERHYETILNAINSLDRAAETIENDMPEDLYCVDLMDVLNYLGMVDGETATEDLINN